MCSFPGSARTIVLALLLFAFAAVPANAASSVAYVDNGSVWLSSLDGTQKVKLADPVTVSDETGSWQEPWIDVAQSDGGRIVAVRNKPGRISSFSWFKVWEPDATSTVEGPLNAKTGWAVYVYPLGFDITADGKHLVYGYSNTGLCCPITFGRGTYVRPATNSVLAPIDLAGQEHPSLVGSRLVVHSGSVVSVQNADAGNPYPNAFTPWFDSSGTGLTQYGTDVAATGTVMAFEVQNNSVEPNVRKIGVISTASIDASPTFPAAVDCYLPATGMASDPSLSQDGTRIAWKDGDGVKVAGVPTTAADPCVPSAPPVVISATGAYPSIGGADIATFVAKPPTQQNPTGSTPTDTVKPTAMVTRPMCARRLTAAACRAFRASAAAWRTVRGTAVDRGTPTSGLKRVDVNVFRAFGRTWQAVVGTRVVSRRTLALAQQSVLPATLAATRWSRALPVLPKGRWTIRVRATDKAGNVGAWTQRVVVIA